MKLTDKELDEYYNLIYKAQKTWADFKRIDYLSAKLEGIAI